MLQPEQFLGLLERNGVRFFCGVPDSLLREFLLVLQQKRNDGAHVICCNEGAAVGLASGIHMGSGAIPLVYMQNSGLGNAINPLTSLAHQGVYGIPMILLIGWRGEPGVSDEPQHTPMGSSTCDLLQSVGIPYTVLDARTESLEAMVADVCNLAKTNSHPYAILCKKGTFARAAESIDSSSPYELSREQAIQKILDASAATDIVVATTGQAGRELLELRGGNLKSDFMNVGAMGHTSQIALGLALSNKQRRVVCIDGDGSVLMHMGGLATIGGANCQNLRHIVLNNGAHDSVGGQPTAGFAIDLPSIARSCGYKSAARCETGADLVSLLPDFLLAEGPTLLEIRVHTGCRDDLARPPKDMQKTRRDFMENLKKDRSSDPLRA